MFKKTAEFGKFSVSFTGVAVSLVVSEAKRHLKRKNKKIMSIIPPIIHPTIIDVRGPLEVTQDPDYTS